MKKKRRDGDDTRRDTTDLDLPPPGAQSTVVPAQILHERTLMAFQLIVEVEPVHAADEVIKHLDVFTVRVGDIGERDIAGPSVVAAGHTISAH